MLLLPDGGIGSAVRSSPSDLSDVSAKALVVHLHEGTGTSLEVVTSAGVSATPGALTLLGTTTSAWDTYGSLAIDPSGGADMYARNTVYDEAISSVCRLDDAGTFIVAMNVAMDALPASGQETIIHFGEQSNDEGGGWRILQSATKHLQLAVKDRDNNEDTNIISADAAQLPDVADGSQRLVMLVLDVINERTFIFYAGGQNPVRVDDWGSTISLGRRPTDPGTASGLVLFARRSGVDAFEQIMGSHATGRTFHMNRLLILKSSQDLSNYLARLSVDLGAHMRELPPILREIPA